MTIQYHNDLIQGTDEWLAARRGLITASEMKLNRVGKALAREGSHVETMRGMIAAAIARTAGDAR